MLSLICSLLMFLQFAWEILLSPFLTGILLYEMLYGYTPFRGKTRQKTFTNILNKDIKFPGSKPVRYLPIIIPITWHTWTTELVKQKFMLGRKFFRRPPHWFELGVLESSLLIFCFSQNWQCTDWYACFRNRHLILASASHFGFIIGSFPWA